MGKSGENSGYEQDDGRFWRNTMQDNVIPLRDEERQRCEVWTRVMGYHRPVSAYNPGKKSEHVERMHFVESEME